MSGAAVDVLVSVDNILAKDSGAEGPSPSTPHREGRVSATSQT